MSVKVRRWKDGWYVVVHYRGRRWSQKFDSAAKAHARAEDLKAEFEARGAEAFSRMRPSEKPTFGEFARRWVREQMASDLAESTREGYRQIVDNHLIPALGQRSLHLIRYPDVKALLSDIARTRRPSTVRNVASVLRLIMAEAVAEGLIDSNPALGVGRRIKGASPQKPAVDPFSAVELDAAEAIFGERFRDDLWWFVVARHTGLRFGEQRALKVADVNFRGRCVKISRSWPAGRSVKSTKTAAGTRTVDLNAAALAAVKAQAKRRAEDRLAGDDSDWLFVRRPSMEPVEHWYVEKRWKRALRLAGVDYRSWHQIRHSYASILLSRGARLAYVSRQLGHSRVSTTLSVYAHWVPDGDRRDVELLNGVEDERGTEDAYRTRD